MRPVCVRVLRRGIPKATSALRNVMIRLGFPRHPCNGNARWPQPCCLRMCCHRNCLFSTREFEESPARRGGFSVRTPAVSG